MHTVLITGGTGLIGKRLTQLLLKKGYKVIILSRNPGPAPKDELLSYAFWDIQKKQIDETAMQQADFVIHLAGAGVVDKRWTSDYKKEILDSRVQSGRLLLDSLVKNGNKVKAVIASSAIGYYGPDTIPGKYFKETDEPAKDFLGQTCVAWEQGISFRNEPGARICKLRTGIVLSNDGGAYTEFKRPVMFGIAAILGSGKQVVSWIHIDDLCRMFIYAIENDSLSGAYNAVAPGPVSNKQLTLLIARALKGTFFIPLHVPSFLLKMIMGGSSIEVLKSTTVSADKIKEQGFTFLYPTIEAAIGELTGKRL